MRNIGMPMAKALVFTPDGNQVKVRLHRPANFAFDDPWGIGARKGWARLNTSGISVAYLGVGAGPDIVQAILNRQVPRVVFLNDIIHENLLACQANVVRAMKDSGLSGLNIILAEGRAERVLEDIALRDGRCLDLVTGCLPQVPDSGRPDTEQIAHVYPVSDYPEMSEWGLGLLHAVLTAARGSLKTDGIVSFVISGRIPWKEIEKLFQVSNFQLPKMAYQFMVRHHLGTPLGYLEGHQGVSLFADLSGSVTISPAEAEEERLRILVNGAKPQDLDVYHPVYIVESSPS